ncbi:MAG: hypothetical protein AAGE92_14850, partial [Cyanobacteria bacterium P01_G01_bin.4]
DGEATQARSPISEMGRRRAPLNESDFNCNQYWLLPAILIDFTLPDIFNIFYFGAANGCLPPGQSCSFGRGKNQEALARTRNG